MFTALKSNAVFLNQGVGAHKGPQQISKGPKDDSNLFKERPKKALKLGKTTTNQHISYCLVIFNINMRGCCKYRGLEVKRVENP